MIHKLVESLKPNIQLFDRNPRLDTYGKLDTYPANLVKEYEEDKKEWRKRQCHK